MDNRNPGSSAVPPNEDRCPVCNKPLSDYSANHRRKHIERCRRCKPTHFYSEQSVGRPCEKVPIRTSDRDKE